MLAEKHVSKIGEAQCLEAVLPIIVGVLVDMPRSCPAGILPWAISAGPFAVAGDQEERLNIINGSDKKPFLPMRTKGLDMFVGNEKLLMIEGLALEAELPPIGSNEHLKPSES